MLMQQIAADQAQLAELAGAYAARQITMAEWLAGRGPIERRIEERSTEFRAGEPHREGETRVRRPRRRAAGGLQRAIIASVPDHVVIKPGTPGSHTFDPSRVKAVWQI